MADQKKILNVETNLTEWLNLSTILFTASLVFYHMTKVKSLLIPKKISGILSLGLIVINIIFTINSVIPYYTRDKNNIKNEEKVYHNVYFYSSIGFVFFEILICYFIIRDSFS